MTQCKLVGMRHDRSCTIDALYECARVLFFQASVCHEHHVMMNEQHTVPRGQQAARLIERIFGSEKSVNLGVTFRRGDR